MAKKSGKRRVPARKAREIQTQNGIERRAALSTGLLFVLLLAAFTFLSLRSSVPEPQQKGIQVMLGKDKTGASKQLKEIQEAIDKKEEAEELKTPDADVAAETKTAKAQKAPAAAQPEESSLTQDNKPAPEMQEKPSAEQVEPKKDKTEEQTKAEAGEGEADKDQIEEQQKPDKDALFTPSDNNQGQQKKEGQQGRQTGDEEVENPSQEGKAKQDEKGISFSLKGRSITKYPSVKDKSQKYGKVVVEITVDENGRVIKAVPGVRGSTVTDQQLKKLARKAALETEFNENRNGPQRQVGKMTINFKLQ